MTRFRMINWWIARKFEGIHAALAAAGVLACLAGIFGGYPRLSQWGGCFLLFWTVVILIHENLHRFWDYLENHQQLDRLPARQMKQVNAFLLLCFLLIFLGLVFLAAFFPWREAGEVLYAGIRAFFYWLGSFFPERAAEYEAEQAGAMPGTPDMSAFFQGRETNPFWEKVSYVFTMAVGISFSLFLLYQAVRRLAEYLGSLRFDGEERVFLKPEEKQERNMSGRRGRRFFSRVPFRPRSHTEQVRRLYRRSVRDALGEGRREKEKAFFWMTPEEIERTAGISHEKEIHQLYEKARYSREGCSSQEAEAMAEHCRRLKQEGR